MNIRLPELTGIEWGVIGAIVFVMFLLVANGVWMQRGHCKPTGREKFSHWQQIGTMLMPISTYEYVCDGGEVRWN